MKIIFTAAIILAACVASVYAQDTTALLKIKKIYVGDLGRHETADQVREKLRARLINSGRFEVVEFADEADAVLTGTTSVVENYRTTNGQHPGKRGGVYTTSEVDYNGVGVFRLLDAESDKLIWIGEYKPRFFKVTGGNALNSEFSRVATNVVKRLLKDIAEAEKAAGKSKPGS